MRPSRGGGYSAEGFGMGFSAARKNCCRISPVVMGGFSRSVNPWWSLKE